MTKYDIPTIFINFEKMVNEDTYLYVKLKPILDQHKKDYNEFKKAYLLASDTSAP